MVLGVSKPTMELLATMSRFPGSSLAMIKFNGLVCLCLAVYVLTLPWRTPPPRQANKGVLKQEVKGLGDRLDRVEERLDRVELAVELAESYRHLRVEHSAGLHEMFEKLSANQLERKNIRQEATAILNREIRQALASDFDEAAAQAKSQELSNGTRSIPVKAALHTLSPFFDIGPVLEWVSKDKAGGYHIVLQRGEPSRLFTRSITQAVNWPLYVLAKLQSPPTGIQIYQDKGPKVRHKGKGKGNKGKGKGVKGKGKSRKGGKGAKGGAVPAAPAADAMDTSCTLYQMFGLIIERFYARLFTQTHILPPKH